MPLKKMGCFGFYSSDFTLPMEVLAFLQYVQYEHVAINIALVARGGLGRTACVKRDLVLGGEMNFGLSHSSPSVRAPCADAPRGLR